MADAPVLETDRLILRPHRVEDFPACRLLWGDPAVVRHIGGQVQDAQAVWFRMLRYAGMWSLLGYGMWALEDRTTGAFLGEAGLLSSARGLPELEGVPEAGWVLAPAAWGGGFAVEAMQAVLHWADHHLGSPVVRCIIEPDNASSVAVAGKLGFTYLAERVLGTHPIRLFERARGI
ncbi:GNAT family N-acetyltransferase [Sphingobium sp. LB126]|uniref:GNAT family N-acetyltransferase n=1 Tax=Sphingobium sp. LB126 TaxID=1983755 RepID=UPI000C204216|nr:GNAT family N-acetyltransferase [Sphingobium sp. LB126]PJG47494.1 GNAT family N-acetyltransferase [Sphingobium sp. LB126]